MIKTCLFTLSVFYSIWNAFFDGLFFSTLNDDCSLLSAVRLSNFSPTKFIHRDPNVCHDIVSSLKANNFPCMRQARFNVVFLLSFMMRVILNQVLVKDLKLGGIMLVLTHAEEFLVKKLWGHHVCMLVILSQNIVNADEKIIVPLHSFSMKLCLKCMFITSPICNST